MPKDLGDVLDHFLPPAPQGDAPAGPPRERVLRALDGPSRLERPAALPLVSLPIGDRDVVRAALVWNLAVEVARQGAAATLLAPQPDEASPLWPEAGRGPLGTEVVYTQAQTLGELSRTALDLAVARAADASDGVVLVRVPPSWLASAGDGRALLRWVLLLASPERAELREAYRLAKLVTRAGESARVGLTVHGVRRIDEAARAFDHVADVAHRHLGHGLVSYGLLVDDLHVYRAIVARRPIGLEHPQSRAARALRDVAKLLLEDARNEAVV